MTGAHGGLQLKPGAGTNTLDGGRTEGAEARRNGGEDAAAPKGEEAATALGREGSRAVGDAELSAANDPMGRIAGGYGRRSWRQRQEYARRERERMRGRVEAIVVRLNIGERVTILDSGEGLPARLSGKKGWYDRWTGRVTIIVGNHATEMDIERTVLHEAVAHLGLRQLLGEHFDTFLDNVYEAAEEEVRAAIGAIAERLARQRGVDLAGTAGLTVQPHANRFCKRDSNSVSNSLAAIRPARWICAIVGRGAIRGWRRRRRGRGM